MVEVADLEVAAGVSRTRGPAVLDKEAQADLVPRGRGSRGPVTDSAGKAGKEKKFLFLLVRIRFEIIGMMKLLFSKLVVMYLGEQNLETCVFGF